MPRALIIGSGVAGPTVALFLQRAGWDTEIFEAAETPDDFGGSFLNVATNGLAVLEALGLRQRLLSDAHPAPHMVMWSGRGQQLGVVPNGPVGRPERGSAVVRRGWLHQVLREAVPSITWGSRLIGIRETDGGVTATFADGRTATGDVLIGCDGIRSVTRDYIDPTVVRPKYSGLVGLGGYARVDGLASTPATQHMVFGARSFFGYLVRDDGTAYWFANVTKPELSRAELADVDWIGELRALHSDDPAPVPQILDAATTELGAYPIYDLVGVKHWSRGRVVALGDAVHATSPSAGQGASLALEDAMLVAKLLRDLPYPEAFAQFQRERQPRADAVVKYARVINGQKRVSKSRLAIAMRDRMMPFFLRMAASDTRNAWLYDYVIDWESSSFLSKAR